jgi:DNA-binding transcriptional ArsR family regulator
MKDNYKARSPPKVKETPTNNPKLLEIWKNLYDELITVYPKSRALKAIGKRYGVSRQTVMYHLFPAYKEKQKIRPSKKWSYEKQNPIIHRKRITYKAKYIAARRHIDELIRDSYQRAAPKRFGLCYS